MSIYITDMENDEFKNIWELYGVRENPFTTNPILVKGGTLPQECFVGREEQIKRLKRILGSRGGSRTLVYGDVGVGKTSFVNIVRAQAVDAGYFTPFKEITVHADWGPDQFILNTLEAFYATLRMVGDSKPVSDETLRKLTVLIEFESPNQQSAGLTLGPVGASYGTGMAAAQVRPTLTLYRLFAELVEEIRQHTRKEIVIHCNNLENLPTEHLRGLFNQLRDFIQTPHVHFIFVGNQSVHASFQVMPRVSSILTDTPIQIGNLAIEEIRKVIQIRFEKLRIGPDITYVVPFTDGALDALYELFGGNMRYILNSFDAAIKEATGERPIRLDKALLASTLKKVAERRYLDKLPPRASHILLEAVKHDEITNRHLSRKTKVARSNVSKYVKDLCERGCMYLRRKDGKDKYWSVEPRIRWYLLREDAEKEKQRKMTEF